MQNMDTEAVNDLLGELVTQLYGSSEVRRQPLRVWKLSGVERLHPANGAEPVIFKYAAAPFAREADVLAHVAGHRLPVPGLRAACRRSEMLGMLLDDLGEVARQPTLAEAAAAAASVHALPRPTGVPVLDARALAVLPAQALASVAVLRRAGRWDDTNDISDGLRTLAAAAPDRAAGGEVPPYGLCHSEFHPSSLHIGADGRWRLLDWARAFVGPGLLDLVSWQGTTAAPTATPSPS